MAPRKSASPTPKAALARLEALGHAKVRAQNAKAGADDNQFGVKLGDIRKLAKEIGTDHALALELWKTGNHDARFLAILLMQPAELSARELDGLVRSVRFTRVADWLDSYVVRRHADKEALRVAWMQDAHPMAARQGWSLTSERVGKAPEGLDLPALLERIERELASVPPEVQWTMNTCLATIGIRHAQLRKRAVAIGERIGLYRDWPVAKGCTPPFVPVWVAAMVER